MFIKLYAIALSVFVAIDMAWIGFVAKNFYRNQIGLLMKSDINWIATYDLTNLATLKDWTILLTVVDSGWGAALAAVVSTTTYFIARKIGLSNIRRAPANELLLAPSHIGAWRN